MGSYKYTGLILKLSICALVGLIAGTLIGKALAHDHNGIAYSTWQKPSPNPAQHRGFSCCNSIDCAPRPTRFKDEHWEVYWEFGKKWLKVPDEKVETNYPDAWDPGDNMGHGCISPLGVVYCMRPGEFLQ
jgi:hypothetical protein